MKKVLIAHQSTIPHYRVPFYNAIEKLKPDSWCFEVVFDPERSGQKMFKEQLDLDRFQFSILPTKTITFKLGRKNIVYQTFWRRAAQYDLIVVEQALNNLTYPCCQLHQLTGSKLAYWGHGKHRDVTNPSRLKLWLEKLKMLLTRQANGFFAYTPGVKSYLLQQGLPSERVFVLNNTIDIQAQRRAFEQYRPQKEQIKQSLGLAGKKVLLFVGRFKQDKRSDFLLEALSIMCQDANFHLLLVGSGGEAYQNKSEHVSYFGSITDLAKLAPIYVAADVFTLPGLVGLGPLQALCYNLPVITIDSSNHKPEIEYLSPTNSIILQPDCTPADYAAAIANLFKDAQRLQWLQANTWSSIEHLTIERMAHNFIVGVNTILNVETAETEDSVEDNDSKLLPR